jgi:DNA-binding winged helix-turn-helix (wHTH) protein/tetratricopeptide (TPR) repeat protein
MTSEPIEIGGVVLEPQRGRLDGPKGSVHTEPRTVELALSLANQAGEVVSRDDLIESIWEGYPGADRALTNSVSKLRGALKTTGAESGVIETVPKRGYRLRAGSSRPLSTPDPALPRIAVLPFQTIGLGPEDEYLGEAIAEDMHDALGDAQGITIAARTSTFALAGRGEPLSEFARQLSATLALEGSVRRKEDRIIVRIALSSAPDGVQHWSRDFEIPETRIDGLSAIMFEAVRHRLRESHGVDLRPAVAGRSSDVPADAYKAFLKGRFFWYRENSNPGRALELYRHAIVLSPQFAAPHAGLVDCYCTYGAWQMMPQTEVRKLALNYAERALSLAPDSPDAQFSHGYAQFYARWRWEDAERTFRHVLRRQPDHILANTFLAVVLTLLHQDDDAIAIGDRLVEIDPASSWCWWMRGMFAYYRRDFECMAESGLEALELSPHEPPVLWIASRGLALCGEHGRARTLVTELEEVAGQSDMFLGIAASVRICCGPEETARAHSAELERRATQRPVSPLVECIIPSLFGHVDQALDALEAALRERNMTLWCIARDPTFDSLRSHPRFKRTLKAMNLPEIEPARRGAATNQGSQ